MPYTRQGNALQEATTSELARGEYTRQKCLRAMRSAKCTYLTGTPAGLARKVYASEGLAIRRSTSHLCKQHAQAALKSLARVQVTAGH